MSNVEAEPAELTCGGPPGGPVEVLEARSVPLGGPRAMPVRRTLPQRKRSLIGAWCFADHYGPVDPAVSGGMSVGPHPHTGLQTVSWLFAGEIEHRDSLGTHAMVRPGELNLMTGGRGICHEEVSTPETTALHGVQLWVALPEEHRHTGRGFQHHAPPVTALPGATARVFLGTLAGETSPVRTYSPLLGAELVLAPGADLTLETEAGFEHGLLVDSGEVTFAGTPLGSTQLGYLGTGHATLAVRNRAAVPARVLLLGGPPFGEEILMWWNFVARSHEEIVAFREAWEAGAEQFGAVEPHPGGPARLPAPALPAVRIRPRPNH
ncbi:pirin family protein [Amycolatopsis jiangsuensis]|uniref:Redox-sensitive bicupin YhaK (Pirin superfamily) n=1 Tax=Amycolatopsis jiangsuensis TaxID=1181879 RepID=A0A840INR4_9PSEU|nr:pirin family protein [Amycolatopsis jiangsuensis]MBB4682848.1 redox-sensitive bicupin YhaK (pirin superfamily) [Amycolatopsis jiangsuensis]